MTRVVDNALVRSDLPCYALHAVESVLYSEYDAVTHIFACAVYTRMLASVHILVPHCVIVHGANVMHLYVYILSVFMLVHIYGRVHVVWRRLIAMALNRTENIASNHVAVDTIDCKAFQL